MNTNVTTWIDIPVIDAIDYFSGVLYSFFGWAVHYAQFFGVIGLAWSAFKLANSRFTVRDFWWDTFYKWILFILLMNLYVPVTSGIAYLGNRIGVSAGNGKQTVITALTNMKNSVEKDLATEQQWKNDLSTTLQSNFANLELPSIQSAGNQTYKEYIDSVSESIGNGRFNSKAQKKEAQAIVDEYRQRDSGQSVFGAKTLTAIKNVLVEKNLDGTDGDKLTNSYIDLDIWLKDANGNETHYISPASLLRVATLSSQILWDKNQLVLTADLDEIEEDDINFIKKGFTKFTATLAHVPSMIMTLICCAALIICIIFSDIQYLMCILEFIIVTGIGAFFIPFILFDGTKEMPKKLVPVFTGFLIKMITMNIIVFFIFNEILVNTIQVMADNSSMNWVTFAGQIFFCFIAFILSSNGPKIAMTLLTGHPQLSMGEFVQMAGSVVATAVGTGRIAKKVGSAGKEGIRKTAQSAVNAHGSISKMASAGRTASNAVKELGGTTGQQRSAAVKGMFAAASGDLKDKFKNTGNNFLHGGKKGTAGGSGGSSGTQAHQRSGQNTDRSLQNGESRTLNNTSNPNFQTATKFDPKTQSNVNMTRGEFYSEKREQGANIGNNIALEMMEKAEQKQQAQKKDTSLPDKLTNNERMN